VTITPTPIHIVEPTCPTPVVVRSEAGGTRSRFSATEGASLPYGRPGGRRASSSFRSITVPAVVTVLHTTRGPASRPAPARGTTAISVARNVCCPAFERIQQLLNPFHTLRFPHRFAQFFALLPGAPLFRYFILVLPLRLRLALFRFLQCFLFLPLGNEVFVHRILGINRRRRVFGRLGHRVVFCGM